MRSEKTNYTFKYFVYQLGQLKGIIIFAAIFSMLFFPCLFVTQADLSVDISVSCLILAIISFFELVAVSFIAPLKAMKHLYTKTSADNILSLPLTSTQRFIADICAGFGAFAVPFAVSIPVSFVVRKFLGVGMDFKIVFLAFFLLLMFAAFNTLLITCCGRKTEAILYPIALNMAVPLFTILGTFISYYNSYGLTSSYEISSAGFWQALDGFLGYFAGATSPLGAFFLAIIKPIQIPIIVSAVMTIVFLAISFVLYKKRPAQRIGQPFVFRPVFAITTIFISISAIIAYIAVSLCFTVDTDFKFGSNIIAVLVIVFILMLIMEFVNSKRIKSIPKFLIKYAATTVGGLLLCLVLYKSEGFGIVSYIPADDNIDYILISQYGRAYNSDNSATIAGGTDAAKLVTDFHKDRLENRNDEIYGEYYNTFNITYYLKNGQTVKRGYPKAEYSFWSELYSSEGYRLDKINALELSDSYTYHSDDMDCLVELVNEHNESICYYRESGKTIPEKLISALKADLSEDTEYGRHSDAAIGKLRLSTDFLSEYVPIYESYVYTLAYLNSMGAQIPTAEQTAQDGADSSLYYSVVRVPCTNTDNSVISAEMILISEEEYKSLLSREALYNTSSDNEYKYYLVLGISSWFIGSPEYYTTGNYDRDAQLQKFEEAGVKAAETTFGSMLYSTAVDIEYNFYSNLINEEMYGELNEMFNERVVIESIY